jgi:hypothetical protein
MLEMANIYRILFTKYGKGIQLNFLRINVEEIRCVCVCKLDLSPKLGSKNRHTYDLKPKHHKTNTKKHTRV